MSEPVAAYVFDNTATQTEGRFGALESLYDRVSIRHLEPFVTAGASCLEIGAGSGSIALWMRERVGPGGHVVATDINTRFLEGLRSANLEVRQHDITVDPVEEAHFDVVHTRLVLVHLPSRREVIDRLVSALRPGGHLVLQEFDSLSMQPDPNVVPEQLLKTLSAMWDLMRSRGVDVRYGRQLFHVLRELDMDDVSAEGHVVMNEGGGFGADLMRANFLQVRDAVVNSGRLTEEEFDSDLARLDDPQTVWPSSVLWTVSGRKR